MCVVHLTISNIKREHTWNHFLLKKCGSSARYKCDKLCEKYSSNCARAIRTANPVSPFNKTLMKMRPCYSTNSSYSSGLSSGLLRIRPVLRCYHTGTITTVKDCSVVRCSCYSTGSSYCTWLSSGWLRFRPVLRYVLPHRHNNYCKRLISYHDSERTIAIDWLPILCIIWVN